MELYNAAADQLSLAWFLHRLDKERWGATVVVQGSWRIAPGGCRPWEPDPDPDLGPELPLPRPPLVVEDDPATPPLHDGDFAPFKPKADILVHGVGHAPGGQPTIGFPVAVGVGGWRKELLVVGPRRWKRGLFGSKATDPEPITEMPLHLGRAFGGTGRRENPFGRGAEGPELPNVEIPGRLVGKPGDNLPPATFGPLHAEHPERTTSLGTPDKRWLATRWPAPPEDFDWAHFNCAPGDQQVEGYLKGDELLTFENLHPEHPRLSLHLPAIRPRVLLHTGSPMKRGERMRHGGWRDPGEFTEFPLHLDTLWAAPHEEVLHLVWRGVLPVSGPRLQDWRQLMVAAEPLGDESAGIPALRAQLERMTAEEDAEFDFQDEPEEEPFELPLSAAFPKAAMEQEAAQAAAEIQAIEARLAARDPDIQKALAAVPKDDKPPDLGKVIAMLSATDPEFGPLLLAKGVDPKALVGEVQAGVQAMQALEQAAAASAPGKAGPDAAAVQAQLADGGPEALAGADLSKARLAGVDLSGARLAGADLSGADLSGADLRRADLGGADLSGADLTAALLDGARLWRADLNGAQLAGAVLDGADLTEADLDGAQLDGHGFRGVDLSGCAFAKASVAGVDWRGARLVDADFSGMALAGADFSDCDLTGADFSEADVTGGVFERADLSSSLWDGARLSGSRFPGAVFKDADFEAADASDSDFRGADLTLFRGGAGTSLKGGNFARVSLRQAVLDQSDLGGSNLRGADLRGASLAACGLVDADLTCGDLTGASLDGAAMQRCQLLKAKLLDASLAGCNLQGADLRGAVLFNAGLDQTDFTDAVLEDVDFGQTLREAVE